MARLFQAPKSKESLTWCPPPFDSGQKFRIDNCRYAYELNVNTIGLGAYRVDIKIDGKVVGSASFWRQPRRWLVPLRCFIDIMNIKFLG
jgi:hypothetical protein